VEAVVVEVNNSMRKISIIISIVLIVFSLTNILAIENNFNTCPMGGINSGSGYSAIVFSWIIYILFILLIISGIYWFIKSAKSKR
jgi:hypothetical protein